MTDTTAPRTAAGQRLNDDLGFHAFLDGTFIEDRIAEVEREAIEPLLALVRAAAEVAREDAMSQSKRTAAVNALRATYRALPESVRVAARKPE